MTIAEEEFERWYFEHGADFNAAHIKPVWIAAWNSANETAAKKAEDYTTMEGYEKEIAMDIRNLK